MLACLAGLEACAATRTWDGGGANNFWMNATNWVGDVAPVAGDDLIFPPGPAVLSCANNFPAGTTFNSLNLQGANYSISGSSIALNAGILATNGSNNALSIPLVLNSNQSFTLNNVSVNLNLSGAIDTNGKDLTFDVASPSIAQIQSVISGSGGLIKTGTGTAYLYSSNTFSGPVQLNQGYINLAHGSGLGTTNGSTTVSNGATLLLLGTITIPEPLVLFGLVNSVGSEAKVLNGPISLPASNPTIQVSSAVSLTVNGVVSGSGGFNKTMLGTLILNGNNTYAGTTTVSGGTLRVNGSQPASPIAVSAATLAGSGTVGPITASNSAGLAPGSSPGILSCSNVALNPGVTLSVELNGVTAGSGYDQINVNGSVSLNNAGLLVSAGFTPAVGNSFVIINNDGADAVIGTFNSRPEGAVINVSGNAFQISYTGGTGNDVVLTRLSPPARFDAITRLANAQMQLHATGGLSGFNYTIEAATNLNPVIQWSNLGTALANGSGQFSFTDTNAPLFPMRFYRALSP